MGLPADHMAELRRGPFPVPAVGDFDDPERELLSKYGYWMKALATGTLAPITPEQIQFVQAAKGETEPRSAFELVWAKYQWTARRDDSQDDPLGLADLFARLDAARIEAAATQDAYAARREAILEQLRPLLEGLDGEFEDHLRTTNEDVARLQAEVRTAVLAFGASFHHSRVNAVYARGRVTWDTKGLTRYIERYPEVAEFRRVGEPFVSLRLEPLTPVPQGALTMQPTRSEGTAR